MSLYFEERMNEQKEDDPENDMITFTHAWIFELPPLNENNEGRRIEFSTAMVTSYSCRTYIWPLFLINDTFMTGTAPDVADDGTCNVSYNLYSDYDMSVLLYSSPEISTTLYGSKVFLTKFDDEFQKEETAKVVIFVELILPAKIFHFNFGRVRFFLAGYNDIDIEDDFRYEFLKNGDYSIKCTDGSILAVGMVLNLSSKFMKKHLKESKRNEFICEHKSDVIKPIMLYLHSLDFEMPKSYNLDYADRLLKAIDFFKLERSKDIKERIESSLLPEFVEENANFDSLLKWIRISLKHSFIPVLRMSIFIIANKHYFKWIDTFSENARNAGNPLFCDIFGPEGHIDLENDDSLTYKTFETIKKTFNGSLFNNVILQ